MSNSSRGVVVAVDFGTTASGYAYAFKSNPVDVHTCYQWPSPAEVSCKTQTSLLYVRHGNSELRVKDWGWPALAELCKRAEKLEIINPNLEMWLQEAKLRGSTQAYYVTAFKILVQDEEQRDQLPEGLTLKRLIVDYLTRMTDFIVERLKEARTGVHSKKDIEWCLTVPAAWNDSEKNFLEGCARAAGMQSPYLVLEPVAASYYCQSQARGLGLMSGDKLLVVDAGGGTVDVVVHQKIKDDAESLAVEEVHRLGQLKAGGLYVDYSFRERLSEEIGCFEEFCKHNASVLFDANWWWYRAKVGFDGDDDYVAVYGVPAKLRDQWEAENKRIGNEMPEMGYEWVPFRQAELTDIFQGQVEMVLDLIERQMELVEGVRVLVVTGGFSASPYLRQRIRQKFESEVEEIVMPADPSRAVCHGAVLYHMLRRRFAARTYGLRMVRDWMPGDPDYVVNDDGRKKCKEAFDVLLRKGDAVAVDTIVRRKLYPASHKQKIMSVHVYSSADEDPMYADASCEEVGIIEIDTGGKDRAMKDLNKSREVEVTFRFGESDIYVTAAGTNFRKGTDLGSWTLPLDCTSDEN